MSGLYSSSSSCWVGPHAPPSPPSLPLCWAAHVLLAALIWAAHVFLVMLGWIAPLLRLFVLDRVATVLRRLSALSLGCAASSTLGGVYLQPLRWAAVVPTLLVAGFALLCWSSPLFSWSSSSSAWPSSSSAFVVLTPPLSEVSPPTSLWGREGRWIRDRHNGPHPSREGRGDGGRCPRF
jgi:hypothetical protein